MRRTYLQLLSLIATLAFAEEIPVAQLIGQRPFPSIFQAWNGATPLPGQDAHAMLAMHDLAFLHPSRLGLASEDHVIRT